MEDINDLHENVHKHYFDNEDYNVSKKKDGYDNHGYLAKTND